MSPMGGVKVWKRDREARALGVVCPHCAYQIELQGALVKHIQGGSTVVVCCTEPLCRKHFQVGLVQIGGYLWDAQGS